MKTLLKRIWENWLTQREGEGDAPPGTPGCSSAALHICCIAPSRTQSRDFKGTGDSNSIKALLTQKVVLCGYQVECAVAVPRNGGLQTALLKSDGSCSHEEKTKGEGNITEAESGEKGKQVPEHCGSVGGDTSELCLVVASSSSSLLAVWKVWAVSTGFLLVSLSAQESHVPQVSAMGSQTVFLLDLPETIPWGC